MAGRARAAKSGTPAASKLQFSVDPRLELDGVIELLAFDLTEGRGGKAHATDFMQPDIPYVREARKWFRTFKSHPAVKRRAQPEFRAFDVGQRGQALVRLSPLPELAPHSQISVAFLEHYVGGAENLARFFQDMRDFYRETGFQEFFEAKKGLLDAELQGLRRLIEGMDYIGKLERYTGLPFEGRYAFIFSPFVLGDTGANVVQRGEDGLADIISVVGPLGKDEPGKPVDCDYPRLPCRVWHEAAHGVLDNVSELYAEEIALKQPAPRKEATREYQNWMHHVREHMVRTVMLRLASLEVGEKYGEEELAHEEECGLPYLREFKARALEYEKDRKRYETIAEFYPALIDALPAPPKGAKPAPLRRENAPHADPVVEAAMPFYTEPQRRRALWYLDKILPRCRRASLLFKRAAINALLGRRAEAAADAAAVLETRPADAVAAAIAKGYAPPQGDFSPGTGPDPRQAQAA